VAREARARELLWTELQGRAAARRHRRAAPRLGPGAFFFAYLVPVRPRRRGERRSLRTLSSPGGASLRPPGSLASFNTRPRRLSTPLLTPLNDGPSTLRTRSRGDPTAASGRRAGGGPNRTIRTPPRRRARHRARRSARSRRRAIRRLARRAGISRTTRGETACHTTPFAWCTPFLKDFSRRHSSPALPFQRTFDR